MRVACPFCSWSCEAEGPTAAVLCSRCRRTFEVFVPERQEPQPIAPAPAMAAAPEAAGAPAQAPPCSRHPANAAVTACRRCGDFLCAVCATPVEGTYLCVPCFEYKRTAGELVVQQMQFRLPDTALYTGIAAALAGWFCWISWVLAPVAIATGILSLRAIRRQPALRGQGKAVAGVVLGSVGLLELAGFLAWIFWLSKGGA